MLQAASMNRDADNSKGAGSSTIRMGAAALVSKAEGSANGVAEDAALLAGVREIVEPLARAAFVSQQVAQVGFDWPDASGSRAKVSEELGELDEALAAGDLSHAEMELGDLLFALVNLGRHHGLDLAHALRRTCEKFEGRFAFVERAVGLKYGGWPRDAEGRLIQKISLEELDSFWEAAKRLEQAPALEDSLDDSGIPNGAGLASRVG